MVLKIVYDIYSCQFPPPWLQPNMRLLPKVIIRALIEFAGYRICNTDLHFQGEEMFCVRMFVLPHSRSRQDCRHFVPRNICGHRNMCV